MRRYELMMVLRADLPEDRMQSTLERVIRAVAGSGGQIVKVSPWGRRRLAYEIDHQRDGSYHIVVFEAEPPFVEHLGGGAGFFNVIRMYPDSGHGGIFQFHDKFALVTVEFLGR